MKYSACKSIADMHLVINSAIHVDKRPVTLCCENLPGVPLSDDPAITYGQLFVLRSQLVADGVSDAKDTRTDVFCKRCFNYQQEDWACRPLISHVNLSVYPSPCQSRCCYCGVRNNSAMYGNKSLMESPEVKLAYDRLFKLIDYGQKNGFIFPDATYQVSCGEITIHPYKRQIMELTRGKTTTYYTNAFQYDADIGRELHCNPDTKINLSIDAGIPETWHKVKGVNNFDQVISNLVHYYQDSIQPGQITLKYIVLPGVNDTLEDYCSIVEIMKVLEVNNLSITRNLFERYTLNDNQRVQLASAAAYLMAILKKNGLEFSLSLYSKEEIDYATQLMNEILEKELV